MREDEGVDAVDGLSQRFGSGQVAGDDLDAREQSSRLAGVAGQSPNRVTFFAGLLHDEASDAPRRTNDEYGHATCAHVRNPVPSSARSACAGMTFSQNSMARSSHPSAVVPIPGPKPWRTSR